MTYNETKTTTRGNRLGLEKSPYLLQHATNPVDWYPWGEEAFEKARREDKPIFLSIGYAACHWCHVMAHESFEDTEVADLLNDTFVCIKVDREERPDVDHVYMEACQRMTGGGGWPLTVFLMPDKRPFYAGTYIPKHGRFGRRGLLDIVPEVKGLWHAERDAITTSADEIVRALNAEESPRKPSPPDVNALHLAFDQLRRSFDPKYAGFGNGTKFPSPHQLSFLLRYHVRFGNAEALEMAERTLIAMRQGGIFDHLGFGFHRYATDPAWRVPHFEKMIYDQAMLLPAYTEAYQIVPKAVYRDTAARIAEYVLRDMTDPKGAFFTAEDADSDGKEGTYYLWTQDEIERVLGPEDAAIFCRVFNVSKDGNFDDMHGGESFQNVLYRSDLSGGSAPFPAMEAWRKKLLETRLRRPRPQKDDKVLTDWNGLMIAALAFAGKVFNQPDWIEAAERAFEYIDAYLTFEDARLLHCRRDGESKVSGHLDDYAFLAWGLLELYAATGKTEHLERAASLATQMGKHFEDTDGGALFFSADDAEVVLKRFKQRYDGACPSGNSVAYLVLQRLYQLSKDRYFRDLADEIASGYADDLRHRPMMYTQFLVGLDEVLELGCEGATCSFDQTQSRSMNISST